MVHVIWNDAFRGKGEQVWLIHSSTQKYVQWGPWQWSGPEYRTSEAVCLLRGSYHLMSISLPQAKTSCITGLEVSPSGFGFVSVMKGTIVSSALKSFRLAWRQCKQQQAVHSFCLQKTPQHSSKDLAETSSGTAWWGKSPSPTSAGFPPSPAEDPTIRFARLMSSEKDSIHGELEFSFPTEFSNSLARVYLSGASFASCV